MVVTGDGELGFDSGEGAVSQAPSPESNPYSPLPVETMVGLYPTIES